MALARKNVTNVPTAVYTSTGESAITAMYFCNTVGTPVTLDIHFVTSGSDADGTNVVYKNVTIPAFDTLVMDTEKVVLGDGDSIRAVSNTNPAVVATVSFLRI